MKDESREHFKEDLNKLCENYGLRIKDIVHMIKNEELQKAEKELRDRVAENSHLVGKTYRKKVSPSHGMFPQMYRYYKVISERSDDSLSVSCLIFDEKPHYWFEYQAHKLHMTGDYHLGYFEFCPIWIDSVRVKNAIRVKGIEDLEEIDADLFDAEMDKLVARIKEMDWVADHYRFGGKLPDDEGWKCEE